METYTVMENMHEQCYTKCSQQDNARFMTVSEGLCFRNCFNKFNNWYPRFNEQTQDAAFKTYWSLTKELEADLKKN